MEVQGKVKLIGKNQSFGTNLPRSVLSINRSKIGFESVIFPHQIQIIFQRYHV